MEVRFYRQLANRSRPPDRPGSHVMRGIRARAAGTHHRHVEPRPQMTVTTQPVLQVQLTAELRLDGPQLLVGLLLLGAVAGLIYLASQAGGELGAA